MDWREMTPMVNIADNTRDRNLSSTKDEDVDMDLASQSGDSVLEDADAKALEAGDAGRMERFALNQERDKLVLWKLSFSDEDLGMLMQENVRISVLLSLVGIAEALLGKAGGFKLLYS
jgi:hypothetical protein